MIEMNCGHCGKRFSTFNQQRKFCNVHCKNSAKTKRWKLKKTSAGLCQQCGKLPIFKGKRCAQHYAQTMQDNRDRRYANKVD